MYKENNCKLVKCFNLFNSIGGWSHERKPRFSRMVQNTTTRAIFIQSAITYMKTHNLDGISIDWEYPTKRGTSVPGDKQKFTLLLKEFREAFSGENKTFTLSASVSAGRRIISTAYEITEVTKHVDWVNIMAYALHGAWEDETGHHTAMAGGLPNVPDSLKAWQELGMPNNKINLGMATYGRSFTLLFEEEYGLGAPAIGAGNPGPFTRGTGMMSYYEFCNQIWSHITPFNKSLAKKPYASRGDQWLGYESPQSLRNEAKTIFGAAENVGLHGIAVWSLGYDDFSGLFCHQGKFPLLKAALRGMVEGRRDASGVSYHPRRVAIEN